MSTVNVSITTKKQSVPASPVASGVMVYALLKDGVQVAGAQGGLSTSFANVADGTYSVKVQAKAMDGSPLGASAMSDPFTVVNMVDADVPDVVSVAL